MNKVVLIGRFTKDPEYAMTQNGIPVAKFSLAVRQSAEKTDFFNLVAFKGTADFIRKFFKKGQQCGVVGRLSQRVWEKDGQKHSAVEVIVEEIHFAGSAASSDAGEQTQTEGFVPITEDDKLPF